MKRKVLQFVSGLCFISITMAFIPINADIHLDGIISDGEWAGAKQYELTGGGRLMIKKESNSLYVAMVADNKGWAHVYLSDGDTVRILHASAALGEALYVKKNNLWRNVQSFKWELRDRVYNEDLAKKQQDHFRQFGWVANNNNTGNGLVFEFKIDLLRAHNDVSSFACLVAGASLDIHHFPATLNDNTVLQKLVQGNTPDSLQFNPAIWEKIR
jgi:hypothetical protein